MFFPSNPIAKPQPVRKCIDSLRIVASMHVQNTDNGFDKSTMQGLRIDFEGLVVVIEGLGNLFVLEAAVAFHQKSVIFEPRVCRIVRLNHSILNYRF
jgi:hypothetical protein